MDRLHDLFGQVAIVRELSDRNELQGGLGINRYPRRSYRRIIFYSDIIVTMIENNDDTVRAGVDHRQRARFISVRKSVPPRPAD